MDIRTRLAEMVVKALGSPERKGVVIVPAEGWISMTGPTWDSALGDWSAWSMSEGYRINSAVFACVSAYSFGMIRSRLVVSDRKTGEPLPEHPAQIVLDKPNREMSQAELNLYTSVYLPTGGNCYWRKIRNSTKNLIGLRPYSDAQVEVVDSRTNASGIDYYKIRQATGFPLDVPTEDMIHLKWPAVDPARPWMGLSPLRVCGREVNSDQEATRLQQAYQKNDGIPRGILEYAANAEYDKEKAEAARQIWQERYGNSTGGNDIAITPPGMTFRPLSPDLALIAFDLLHNVPETRIAADLKVPLQVAGLNASQKVATYANFAEARKMFTEDSLMPLCILAADEIEQEFRKEWPEISVKWDFSQIPALQENEDAKYTRMVTAYEKGVVWLNEARQKLGFAPVDGGDVFKVAATPLKITATPDDTTKQYTNGHAAKGATA